HDGAVLLHDHVLDAQVEVGHGGEQLGEERAYAVGRGRVDLAADVLAAARPPQRDHRVHVPAVQRVEILGGNGLRAQGAREPNRFPVAPTSPRTRGRGRGERVMPGVWRLRLPLPWPGVPHCNAWAVAAGDGIVLFDTGMHEPGSLAHLERAM